MLSTFFKKLTIITLVLFIGNTALADGHSKIKIGILHSLSGTMAISETTLKDTMLMLIDEQNKKGGLLGKKLEPVVVDPASNWPLFAEKARELLTVSKVDVMFGCWTSVSRKSALPVPVSYTHLRAHETSAHLVCRLLLEKKNFLLAK